MEIIQYLAKPSVIGPLVGLFAVIGWAVISVSRHYFNHQERMEKIRMGMDPDAELQE